MLAWHCGVYGLFDGYGTIHAQENQTLQVMKRYPPTEKERLDVEIDMLFALRALVYADEALLTLPQMHTKDLFNRARYSLSRREKQNRLEKLPSSNLQPTWKPVIKCKC